MTVFTYILQILLVLLGLYIVFCLAPAVVMFLSVFRHRTDVAGEKAYYEPYRPLLEEAAQTLDALPFTEVSLTAHDGVTLRADAYDGGYDRTAILFHGYRASPRSNCAHPAALLANNGYNILLVHQRAHGKSGGANSTLGYLEKEDALLWTSFAAESPAVHHIVLYGVSMGAAALAFAADRIPTEKVRAIILDCGFTGIWDQLREDSHKLHVPGWTVLPIIRLLFRLRFGGDIKTPTANSLKNARVPALFVHGKTDDSVPFSHGESNFAACGSEKETLFVDHALHTCALLQGGDSANASVLAFLDKHMNTTNQKEIVS